MFRPWTDSAVDDHRRAPVQTFTATFGQDEGEGDMQGTGDQPVGDFVLLIASAIAIDALIGRRWRRSSPGGPATDAAPIGR